MWLAVHVTMAVFLMHSPVTMPASPALLMTCRRANLSQHAATGAKLVTAWMQTSYLELNDATKSDFKPVL